MKLKIGITGGIGSGKSYVCRLLETQAGIQVYYCDDEAKRLNVESPIIRKQLTALVGTEVYHEDGSLNKSALIAYLFASQEHAQQVNAIVHPVVLQDFLEWADRQESCILALEAALLFEAGYQDKLDCTVLVTAPEELRIQRIIQRDHTTAELAQQRIRVQCSDEEKRKRADFVITNDGETNLEVQIEQLLAYLRSKTLDASKEKRNFAPLL